MLLYKYMHIPVLQIPVEFLNKHNLYSHIFYRYIYVEIYKGMYSFQQASKLDNILLKTILVTFSYYETIFISSLLKHAHLPAQFTLVVDNFGIKCIRTFNFQTIPNIASSHLIGIMENNILMYIYHHLHPIIFLKYPKPSNLEHSLHPTAPCVPDLQNKNSPI